MSSHYLHQIMLYDRDLFLVSLFAINHLICHLIFLFSLLLHLFFIIFLFLRFCSYLSPPFLLKGTEAGQILILPQVNHDIYTVTVITFALYPVAYTETLSTHCTRINFTVLPVGSEQFRLFMPCAAAVCACSAVHLGAVRCRVVSSVQS